MCDNHLLEDIDQLCVASQEVLPHVLLQAERAVCLHRERNLLHKKRVTKPLSHHNSFSCTVEP